MTATNESMTDLIDRSLVYERAFSRLNAIVRNLVTEMKAENSKLSKAGEKPDESFRVLIDMLYGVKNDLREKSDALFQKAEIYSLRDQEGYHRLAQAVMENAAQDYEMAICGIGNSSERMMIEMFARNGAEKFTSVDFSNVLKRIRRAKPLFSMTCKKHVWDIISDTEKARKPGGDIERNRVCCPLCGRPLYADGRTKNMVIIRCLGCALFEEIYLDD